jgi:hypothetical protein
MVTLHVRGAKVLLEDTKITIQIPKKSTEAQEKDMKKAALAYLVGEAFISNLKTREVIIERI